MKRLENIRLAWSPDFAYAIGLITTDGCLSKDGRHLDLTSKDKEVIETFRHCLRLTNKIGLKARGGSSIRKYYRIQFGDINFYTFLLSIGLTPAKSKILGPLKIERDRFADFLRGCIDGDGCINTVSHPESKHPQLRLRLSSASPLFLGWIKKSLGGLVAVKGGWISQSSRAHVLTYAKADAILILNYIYYPGVKSFLNRKYTIAKPFLRV